MTSIARSYRSQTESCLTLIRRGQIVQRPAGLDVLLARPGDVDTSVLAASLSSALEAQGVVAPSVTIRAVETIPHTALGKAPLIVRGT